MADTDFPVSRRRKPWALTFFGLLAVGGLIAMPFLAGPPDGGKMPDIVRFLGHFHPVLLHLPIGVFILIVLQELGAIFGKRHHEQVANTAMFPLFFGVASAIIAVIAGFLLYQGTDDYAGNALAERHLWGGLIFAVAAVVTFILKAWTVALSGNPAFYRLLLFASISVMGFASHDGASITHGENYLTEYAPDPVRTLLGLEKKSGGGNEPGPAAPGQDLAARLVYADVVAPIFERRCVQCHKDGKAKGKFRMDSYELLVKGGKEGPGLEPEKSAESNIMIRMELPEDDDERMPPEGKPGMEAHELAIVKWWIDNGADPKKSLADFDLPAPIKEALAKLAPAGSAAASGDSEEGVSPHEASAGPDDALKSSVAAISKEYPGALSFESQQSALLTFTAVSLRGNLDDAGFKKLESVTPQFVTVDLSATRITDQAVAQLASAGKLRLIRLSETGVTDAAIETLIKLPTLESINLYGTKVTDAGVSKLSSLTNLKHLYLWKTAVTPEAIKSLQEKLPDCKIITGIES
ncbi:MAG: c-type cytochrome domain-containing protein [Verrucomicrobiota bacterium]